MKAYPLKKDKSFAVSAGEMLPALHSSSIIMPGLADFLGFYGYNPVICTSKSVGIKTIMDIL